MSTRLLTTREVAEMHGVRATSVTNRARALGLTAARTVGGAHLWTPEQARALAPGKAGRPRNTRQTPEG